MKPTPKPLLTRLHEMLKRWKRKAEESPGLDWADGHDELLEGHMTAWGAAIDDVQAVIDDKMAPALRAAELDRQIESIRERCKEDE